MLSIFRATDPSCPCLTQPSAKSQIFLQGRGRGFYLMHWPPILGAPILRILRSKERSKKGGICSRKIYICVFAFRTLSSKSSSSLKPTNSENLSTNSEIWWPDINSPFSLGKAEKSPSSYPKFPATDSWAEKNTKTDTFFVAGSVAVWNNCQDEASDSGICES